MGGLAQGFAQGFQMMDAHYNRQDNRDIRQQQLGMQNRRLNMAEESHAANMVNAGLNTQLLQGQVDDMPAATEYRNTMRGLQLQGQQASVDGQKKQNAIQDFNLTAAKTSQNNAAQDRKNQLAQEAFKIYETTGEWDKFIQDPTFKGTPLETFQHIEGAEAALELTNAISNQDINTIVDKSNFLFKRELNRNAGKIKGRDGGTIRDISIIDFAVQPDGGVKVPVRVTTDNGSYPSYISELRGIDPNDPDRVYTYEDFFGKAAAMGQLASVLKSSGVYEKMQSNAQRYLAPKNGKGSGVPAKVHEMEYTRRLLGDEQFNQWLMYGRGKSPQELRLEAYKLASTALGNDMMFDSPDEKKAAIDKMADELVTSITQSNQSGGQGAPQPGAASGQYAQLLQQAAAAIQSGKDRNAVIQRLVQMGVPQDQINL